MATTFTTPNMGMVVPVVGQELGPQWAIDEYNIFVNILDTHNHTSGKGVLVPTAGLNINADLGFGSFNATSLRSTRYTAQGSPLSLGTDKGCVYVSGADLWFNDTAGNQIRLTNTGNANFSFLAYPERTPAISGNFTILATDQFNLYYVDTSGGVATVNLPASSGVAVGRTYIFVDIKRNASTNSISIVPNGADKINTVNSTYTININGIYTILTTDGAGNWYANPWGGFDPLNISTNLQWIAGISNPTLTVGGTGPNSGTAQTVTIKGQVAGATNGTPGGVLLVAPSSTGSGSHGYISAQAGTNVIFAVGDTTNVYNDFGLIWLSAQATAPSNANYSIFSDGANLNLSAASPSGSVFFNTNGATFSTATTTSWKYSVGGATITMARAASGAQNSQAGIIDQTLQFNRTTTTGATFTVDTPVPTTTSIYLRIVTVGRLVSGTGTVGDTGMKVLEVLAKNIAGTVTVVGTGNPTTFNDTNFNMGSTAAANSTNVRLTVTAPSNEGATPTIDWEVWIIPVVD